MSNYQRPWWVFAVQMPLLETILQENHQTDEQINQKRFIIEGKPVLKSLIWISYGPLFAIITLIILVALAWGLDIRSQSSGLKLGFGCMLGVVPFVGWALSGFLLSKLSQPHLNRQVEANTEQVEFSIDLKTQTFQLNNISSPNSAPSTSYTFNQINGFKLITDTGVYYDPKKSEGASFNLVMETNQGQQTLLSKTLGTIKQKLQLVSQLEAIIKISE